LSLPESLVVAGGASRGSFTLNESGTGQGIIMKKRRCDAGAACDAGQHRGDGGDLLHRVGAVTPAVAEGSPAPFTPPGVDGESGDGDHRRSGGAGAVVPRF